MRRFAISFLAAAALAFGPEALGPRAFGQSSAANSGPTLGFVAGPAGQLQPIFGIPGAARLGNPVALPQSVTQVFVAPGQNYALAAQGAANPVALVVLRVNGVMQTNLTLTALPGALATPDLVAFSPGGGSAALYSQQAGMVQVFTGLPGSPKRAQQISGVGAVALLAVSDDAQAVLISDGVGNVYALAQNAAAAPVYHTEMVSALAFFPQSHEAILCDPYNGSTVVGQAVDGITIFPAPDTCQPRAATATADGKTILLACPASHLIWSIDRASGAVAFHSVSNTPYGFTRLGLRDTFLMSPADGFGTFWLFAWQDGEPVSSFVAAAPQAGAGQ
jgi:hypothetical protein